MWKVSNILVPTYQYRIFFTEFSRKCNINKYITKFAICHKKNFLLVRCSCNRISFDENFHGMGGRKFSFINISALIAAHGKYSKIFRRTRIATVAANVCTAKLAQHRTGWEDSRSDSFVAQICYLPWNITQHQQVSPASHNFYSILPRGRSDSGGKTLFVMNLRSFLIWPRISSLLSEASWVCMVCDLPTSQTSRKSSLGCITIGYQIPTMSNRQRRNMRIMKMNLILIKLWSNAGQLNGIGVVEKTEKISNQK